MSRLFAIDERRELNALYILTLALALNEGTDVTELAMAFYLYRNPTLLSELASSDTFESLRAVIPDYEYTNLTSNYRSYSPAVLDEAFKSGLEFLVSLQLIRFDNARLMPQWTGIDLQTIPERVKVRARAVAGVLIEARSDLQFASRIREAARVK